MIQISWSAGSYVQHKSGNYGEHNIPVHLSEVG